MNHRTSKVVIRHGAIAGMFFSLSIFSPPGAAITVIHLPSGVRHAAASDATGRFVIGSLLVGGPYLIRVNHALESEKISGTIKTKTALETVLRWTPIRT